MSQSPKHRRRFLRQSSVWAAIVALFFGKFAISAILPILEPHLRQIFNLHFTVEGIVIAVIPLSFAFGAALWQWLITRDFIWGLDSVSISGLLIFAVMLLLLGPCKAFHIPVDLLWLNVVCFLAIGGAASMVWTSSLNTLLECAELKKLNKLAAYFTITNLVTITQCIGLVVGAPIGGYLNQCLDFQLATSIIAAVLFGGVVLGIIYTTVKCILRVAHYRRLLAASEAELAETRRTARNPRAPVIGASLATSVKPTILDTRPYSSNTFTLSRKPSRQDDRRPLLTSPSSKGRSYGTYL